MQQTFIVAISYLWLGALGANLRLQRARMYGLPSESSLSLFSRGNAIRKASVIGRRLETSSKATISSAGYVNKTFLRSPQDPNIFVVHKWGYVMSRELLRPRCRYLLHEVNASSSKSVRAGDVVVVREVYESVLSGYLYHKGGAECGLDEYFNVNPPKNGNSWLGHYDWYKFIKRTTQAEPYRKNRNFCAVLGEMPEELGLQIYAEFAYNRWYSLARQFLGYVEKHNVDVLKVCLGNFSEKVYQKQTLLVAKNSFWRSMCMDGNSTKNASSTGGDEHAEHSTEGLIDSGTRARMLLQIEQIDGNVLNYSYARLQEMIGCSRLE